MHADNHRSEDLLRSRQLRVTPLRKGILELLGHAASPLSVEEISKGLRKIKFDQASLFRTLKALVESGVLAAVDLGEGFSRYERTCEAHGHHHHIICRECKEITVLPFCVPKEILRHLRSKGYADVTHRMDFSGICRKCAG